MSAPVEWDDLRGDPYRPPAGVAQTVYDSIDPRAVSNPAIRRGIADAAAGALALSPERIEQAARDAQVFMDEAERVVVALGLEVAL